METQSPSEGQHQIVTFDIADQEFGLDVFDVQEIIRYRSITAIPGAPDFVEGVVALRGDMIPVVDLRKRFSVQAKSTDSTTPVVVVSFAEDRLGLVVDAVSEVVHIDDGTVTDPPEYVRGIAARYVRKLVRLDDRIIILLDIGEILTSEERIALGEMHGEDPDGDRKADEAAAAE